MIFELQVYKLSQTAINRTLNNPEKLDTLESFLQNYDAKVFDRTITLVESHWVNGSELAFPEYYHNIVDGVLRKQELIEKFPRPQYLVIRKHHLSFEKERNKRMVVS